MRSWIGVKYVKVQTTSNVDGSGIGERVPTEVSAIYKTDAAAAPVGVTAAPASISINGQKLALKDGVDVYSAVADTAVEVAVDAPENTNVINDVYGKSAKFDSLNHRMVRVVVGGEKAKPVIYYVNLKTQAQADEDAVADVIAKIDAIGEVTRTAAAHQGRPARPMTLSDAQKSLSPTIRPAGCREVLQS